MRFTSTSLPVSSSLQYLLFLKICCRADSKPEPELIRSELKPEPFQLELRQDPSYLFLPDLDPDPSSNKQFRIRIQHYSIPYPTQNPY